MWGVYRGYRRQWPLERVLVLVSHRTRVQRPSLGPPKEVALLLALLFLSQARIRQRFLERLKVLFLLILLL